MSEKTTIAWTDATWNPVRGCSRVSEGCRHCYAERVAARFSGPGLAYEGLATAAGWTGDVRLVEAKITEPEGWRKPRKVFVNSMSDLFHEKLQAGEIDAVLAEIVFGAPQHTYQVLTKRPRRMYEHLSGQGTGHERLKDFFTAAGEAWPIPNLWLGVSVEDQKTANERIPLLLKTPAAVRFVSLEPLLEEVDVAPWLHRRVGKAELPETEPVLDWVIIGGESGPLARRFDVAWARKIIAACRAEGVAVFMKQTGSARPSPFESKPVGNGDDPSRWPEDLRVQEFPKP